MAELALAAGLSVEQLSSYEAGLDTIPVATLVRLGVALRAPLDRLLDPLEGQLE